MSDKPERVRLIHIPIYSSDTLLLSMLPEAGSTSQWIRNLILRQIQMDAQLMKSLNEHTSVSSTRGSDDDMMRAEVRQVIQTELEPILDDLDKSINDVIEQKISHLQSSLMQVVQASIQSALAGHVPVKSDPKPEADIPAWQMALGKGIAGG